MDHVRKLIQLNKLGNPVSTCSSITFYNQFLAKNECKAFREAYEDDEKIDHFSRICGRNIHDHQELANALFERLYPKLKYKEIIDEFGEIWVAYGLNRRFRLCKYSSGGKFAKHEDGFYQDKVNSRSFATLMIYLNTVPVNYGGATYFNDYDIRIQPKEGSAICFLVNNLLHEGEELKAGTKYILRTDIMYTIHQTKSWPLREEIFALRQKANDEEDETLSCDIWMKVCQLESELKAVCAKKELWENPIIIEESLID